MDKILKKVQKNWRISWDLLLACGNVMENVTKTTSVTIMTTLEGANVLSL